MSAVGTMRPRSAKPSSSRRAYEKSSAFERVRPASGSAHRDELEGFNADPDMPQLPRQEISDREKDRQNINFRVGNTSVVGYAPSAPVTTVGASESVFSRRPVSAPVKRKTYEDKIEQQRVLADVRKLLDKVPVKLRDEVRNVLAMGMAKQSQLKTQLGEQTRRATLLTRDKALLEKDLLERTRQLAAAKDEHKTAIAMHDTNQHAITTAQNQTRMHRDQVELHKKRSKILTKAMNTISELHKSQTNPAEDENGESMIEKERRSFNAVAKSFARENKSMVRKILTLETTITDLRAEMKTTKEQLRVATLKAKYKGNLSDGELEDIALEFEGDGEVNQQKRKKKMASSTKVIHKLNTNLGIIDEADHKLVELLQSGQVEASELVLHQRRLINAFLTIVQKQNQNPFSVCTAITDHAICSLFNCELAAFFAVEGDGAPGPDGKITQQMWNINTHRTQRRYVPTASGITGHTVATGEVIRMVGAKNDPLYDPAVDGHHDIDVYSILSVPIVLPYEEARDRVLGVLQLVNKRPHLEEFTEVDAVMATFLAVRTALALSQAETVAAQHARADVLGRIAKAPGKYLASTAPSDFGYGIDLLTAIMKLENLACEVLRAKVARIYVYSPEQSGGRMWMLKSLISHGDTHLRGELQREYFNLTSSIAAVTARHREAIYIHNATVDENFNEEVDLRVNQAPLACAPICSINGQLLGVIQISPSSANRAVDQGHHTNWGSVLPLSTLETIVYFAELIAPAMQHVITLAKEKVEASSDHHHHPSSALGEMDLAHQVDFVVKQRFAEERANWEATASWQHNKLGHENRELKKEVATVTAELHNAKGKHERLQDEIDSLKRHGKALQRKGSQYRKLSVNLIGTDEQLAKDLHNIDSVNDAAEIQVIKEAELRKDNESIRNELVKAQAEVRMVLLEAERVEDEKKLLESQLEDTQHQLVAAMSHQHTRPSWGSVGDRGSKGSLISGSGINAGSIGSVGGEPGAVLRGTAAPSPAPAPPAPAPPVEAPSYVGRNVSKDFDGSVFSGLVESHDPLFDKYKVVYEDGDSESLGVKEIEAILV
mmetsp:Transcript_8316/g.19677  ORF Transcript_8316/g.19677 Transcript_8316/m.19677 type:complete len:1064 (-) Transcript_8316:103-3294(-)